MTVTAEHVKALVRRHIEGDDDGFYSIALQLAARAAREGKSRFAQDLRELIDSAKTPTAATQLRPTPIAQPRGELAGLMSVTYPDVPLDAMTLTPSVRDQLSRVITEQRQRDRLAGHGLDPIHRLLLVGPPGTGKSMSASMLAHELKIPLFTIQLDVLISKYMGETASKLRHVFDAVASTRAVYLFDEFDALGTHRMAANDVGEVRRVLNSFLQFLEAASPASLVVAATNHPQLLDKALFRRFDQVIEYGLPDAESAMGVIRNRLTLLDTRGVNWPAVRQKVGGLSHAELVRAAEAAAKRVVLSGRHRITTTALVSALDDRRRHADE
jgi:SpoVK/Ycf46/Vps4 family AAA+-type ATPase